MCLNETFPQESTAIASFTKSLYFFFKLKRSFAQNYIYKGKDKNLPQRNKEYFLLTYVLPLTIN